MNTLTQILQVGLPTGVSIMVVLGGFIFGYGKLKASMVTKDECKNNQKHCTGTTDASIKELKNLTIELHDRQSKKIESLQEKIEATNISIGKIQGYLVSPKTLTGN